MINPYDQQLGDWGDAMPDGGAPRMDMGLLESSVPYRDPQAPKWVTMARISWSDWTLGDEGLWLYLAEKLAEGNLVYSGQLLGGNLVDKFYYDAFVEAAGNFGVFVEIIGKPPVSMTGSEHPNSSSYFSPGGGTTNLEVRLGVGGITGGIYYGVKAPEGQQTVEMGTPYSKPLMFSLRYISDVIFLS